MKRKILTVAMALIGIATMAQEKVRVHNGNSNYVTTIEQITFDVTDADQAISVTDLEAENDSLSTANATLAGEKASLETEKTALANEKTALATMNESLAIVNAAFASEKAALATANDLLKAMNGTLTSEKAVLKAKNDSLATANATLTGEKSSLTNEKTALSVKNDSLLTSNAKLAGEKTALATKNDSLATANATLTSEKDALKADTTSLKLEKQALESQIVGLNSQVEGLKTDTTSLKAEIQTLNDRIELLMFNGHDYVDLGLSVMWATCNVGANAPEEYGDYFAWGEIEGYNSGRKTSFSWSTYKWCNGSNKTMTKYCTTNSYGTVDNKTQLDFADDAARANWGGKWRMPTQAEWEELYNNTTRVWTDNYNGTGVKGYVLTSTKEGYGGASIFLPAAGYRINDGYIYSVGSDGCFWSSSLLEDNSDYGCYLDFRSGYFNPRYYNYRCNGQSVRPVCPSAK